MYTPLPGIHDIIRLGDVIPESDDRVLRHARSVINKSLRGSLTVEFDCRQVVLSDIPGDVAMRFHAIVSDHREGDPSSARWADQHDPRYSTADARLVTFEVARIIAVLWEPERLAHGDASRRKVLAASIRIVQTSAKYEDPGDWTTQDFADYAAVSLDLESSDNDSAEPEADDDEEAGDDSNDEAAGPDLDDPGGAASATPERPTEDGSPGDPAAVQPPDELDEGGDVNE